MGLRSWMLWGGAVLATAAGLMGASAPAQAQCVLAGGTVNCAGNDQDGFTGGNALTVRIETGAAVDSVYDGNPDTFCPVFRAGLRLGQNARVTNLGQIAGRGNCAIGLEAGSGLQLTNDGIILADSQVSFAVLTTDGFNVVNRGTFSTTSSDSAAFIGVNGGTFVNAASGLIDIAGAGASGIVAENANTVTNDGRIVLRGAGSFGLDLGASNTVVNTGAITASGVASSGIRLRGSGNVITNGGTVTTLPTVLPRDGEDSIGIVADVGGNTIANSGTIAGDYAGVLLNGANNTLVNGGTISARAPSAASILGGGIVIGSGSATITNNGTIRGIGSAAIRAQTDGFVTLVSSGTIEGDIVLGNAGSNIRLIATTLRGTLRGTVAGVDTLILEGNATMNSPILNFDVIEKRLGGTWSLTTSGGFVEAAQSITISEGRIDATGFRTPRMTVGRNADLYGPLTITGTATGATFGNTLLRVDGSIVIGRGTSARQEVTSVQGDVELSSTSRVEARLATGFGDLLSATGRITLGGGVLNLRNGISPPVDGASYTIITAQSLRNAAGTACAGTLNDTGATTGTPCFGQLTDLWPAFIRSSATVTGTSVIVSLQRIPYASVAQSSEARAVAGFLDFARVNVGGLFGLIPILDQMTEETARAAFATYSSDQSVSLQTWNILAGDALVSAVTPWLNDDVQGTQGSMRAWGSLFARAGEGGPTLDAGHFDYEVKGAVAGMDFAVTDGTRIGFMAAHAEGDTFFPTGVADADISNTSVGMYLSHAAGPWRMSLGGLVGNGEADLTRIRTGFNGTPQTITAAPDTDADVAFAQASYTADMGGWSLGPAAQVTYAHATTAAYRESGGMDIGAQTDTSWRADVGARAATDAGPVRLTVGAFWSQNLEDNDRATSADEFRFPGSAFVISGRTEKRGWLKTQARASMDITPDLTARLTWTGILNDRLGGHSATAGLSYRW
ncbi:MAG: autotransporter domain-containing protein [Rhodospirillaceae bacterium]|nr:autotransporter domain-containing protein [Rhodospirillaceae bacterium]